MPTNRNFEVWLATFRAAINDYDYYTDFAKVYANAERLKAEIYQKRATKAPCFSYGDEVAQIFP